MAGFTGAPPIVTDGLVFAVDAANYESYTSGSDTWYDLSGNSNNGTLVNGPTFDEANGGSLVFDGTDDEVDFGNNIPATNFEYTDNFSLEAWFVTNDTSDTFQQIIGKSFSDYRVMLYGGKISFRLDANKLTTLSGDLTAGEWTHMVATWEASTSTARVYQDGVLQTTKTDAAVDWTTHLYNKFKMGESGNESYNLDGKIAIGRAYSIKLSDEQVLQNYNAQKNRFL